MPGRPGVRQSLTDPDVGVHDPSIVILWCGLRDPNPHPQCGTCAVEHAFPLALGYGQFTKGSDTPDLKQAQAFPQGTRCVADVLWPLQLVGLCTSETRRTSRVTSRIWRLADLQVNT